MVAVLHAEAPMLVSQRVTALNFAHEGKRVDHFARFRLISVTRIRMISSPLVVHATLRAVDRVLNSHGGSFFQHTAHHVLRLPPRFLVVFMALVPLG